jgi:hypothetical protein
VVLVEIVSQQNWGYSPTSPCYASSRPVERGWKAQGLVSPKGYNRAAETQALGCFVGKAEKESRAEDFLWFLVCRLSPGDAACVRRRGFQ